MAGREEQADTEVEYEQWFPADEGDSIEGIMFNKDTIAFAQRIVGRYEIATALGVRVVLGTLALDRTLGRLPLPCKVKIIYKGTISTKQGFDMKLFSVLTTKEVAGAAAARFLGRGSRPELVQEPLFPDK